MDLSGLLLNHCDGDLFFHRVQKAKFAPEIIYCQDDAFTRSQRSLTVVIPDDVEQGGHAKHRRMNFLYSRDCVGDALPQLVNSRVWLQAHGAKLTSAD